MRFMRFAPPYCVAFWDLRAPRHPTVFLLGFMHSSYPAFSLGILRSALPYCFFWIYALRATILFSLGIYALCATLLLSFGIYALRATLLLFFLGFMRCALPYCVPVFFCDLCAARYPTVFLCSFWIKCAMRYPTAFFWDLQAQLYPTVCFRG